MVYKNGLMVMSQYQRILFKRSTEPAKGNSVALAYSTGHHFVFKGYMYYIFQCLLMMIFNPKGKECS